jgi:hypothetical protein
MLVLDPKDRRGKGLENRERILSFLCVHTYSTIDVLMSLLQIKTKPLISRHLSKLIRDGLVKKAEIKNSFGRVVLFGITRKAIDENVAMRPFQPCRINLMTLEHTLFCQKTSAFFLNSDEFEKHEMTLINVEVGDVKKYGFKHRPDLLLKPKYFNHICIEVELSIKSKARYNGILRDYVTLLEKDRILQVIYVFYNKQKSDVFNENILKPLLLKMNKVQFLGKFKIKVLI